MVYNNIYKGLQHPAPVVLWKTGFIQADLQRVCHPEGIGERTVILVMNLFLDESPYWGSR